jgi:rare lipoprotein A
MKRISIFIFAICFGIMYVQYTAAQSSSGSAETFRQEGIASWYGTEFDGRPTASGEIFDSSRLTAAHPSLPFGTFLLVTNRQNNRQVAVKVNDRGPFVASRIVDVSRAAAEQLDMINSGLAHVVIETIQSSHLYPPSPVYTHSPSVPHQSVTQQPAWPPVYSQPLDLIQAPVITQAPAPVTMPPSAPVPQPAPVPAQAPAQPQVFITQPPAAASDSPAMASYAPITVTVYPPPQSQFPQQQAQILYSQPVAPAAVTMPPPQMAPPQVAPNPADHMQIVIGPPPAPVPAGARLIPPISPVPGKTYTLQVGSFRVAGNAVETYTRLRAAGLNPAYERNEDFFRVVLPGIRGSDVQSVAEVIEIAGFKEAIIREER